MTQRIRGRALQDIRRRWFQAHPLCVLCSAQGRVAVATELDHILALTNGGLDVDSNRQGLCSKCHEDKTNADLGRNGKRTYGPDGWPV